MTKLMLCQDCLATIPYIEQGHLGEIKCTCGGDYCGCDDCADYAARLQQNHQQREAQIDCFEDIKQTWIQHPDRGWCLAVAQHEVAKHL